MKYSKNFERDFEFYFRMRKAFWFSGDELRIKGGDVIKIVFDRNGIDAKKAFHLFDSTGVLNPTKHPNLLFALLKCKASTNWHIKQYATDRASYLLSKIELVEIYDELKVPEWFKNAVEQSTKRIRMYGV